MTKSLDADGDDACGMAGVIAFGDDNSGTQNNRTFAAAAVVVNPSWGRSLPAQTSLQWRSELAGDTAV